MGLFGKKKEEKEDEQEEKPEEGEENTYEEDVTCDNCEDEMTVEIPCGTKVKDFLIGKKCERCECIFQEDKK